VRVEGGSFDWVWGLKELIITDQMDLPCHMRWWDIEIDYVNDCVDSQWVVWQVQVSGC